MFPKNSTNHFFQDYLLLHSGHLAFLGLLCVTLLLAVAQAQAGTIRHDLSDSEYTTLANKTQFAPVGEFLWSASGSSYLASGTLIDSQWVLTAAHVVEDITADNIGTMTFTLGEETYYVEETYYHSGWTGTISDGNDIGIVKLTSAVTDVAPAYLYDQTDEVYRITTVVGYGKTGTGLSGAIYSAGTKRAGTNVVGLGSALNNISWSSGGNDDMIVADFDQPGNTGDPTTNLGVPTDLEYCAAPGDSGGGWFIEDDGIYYLAGVTSFLLSNPSSTRYSMYGDIFGATRVSSYLDWIARHVDISGPVLGDANGDDIVDEADALILANHWEDSGYWSEGDFNGDGVVDADDASIMAANWGFGTEQYGQLSAVPEPGIFVALLFGALMLLSRRGQ